MLDDNDIVYIDSPDPILAEPAELLAMDENYIEAAQLKMTGYNLTEAEIHAQIEYCQATGQDGEFWTSEGAHYVYSAEENEARMVGFERLPNACKFFSPTQGSIDELDAQVAKDYKYDRAYVNGPCCQSRKIDSPFCIAASKQEDCAEYQEEEWTPVKLAVGEKGESLVWNKGRLYSGVPYERISKNNSIISAKSGKDRDKLDGMWTTQVAQTNATEQVIPEPGPKNPYLQSLLT